MKRLLMFIILVMTCVASFPQGMTTMGKEFWFLFMDNGERNFSGDRHRVIVTAKRACSVTISMPAYGWQTTANVDQYTATVVPIPVYISDNQTSGQVLNKGFRLLATDTVSVYVSTLGNFNYEVANVLPLSVLRDEYMLQSYPSDRWGSEFAIVSTGDSTWVDICLSSNATTGAHAGDTVTVLLTTAGQVYQLKSEAVGDFSGTTIKSRDCKPIGVFHGDVCVYIPTYSPGATCDHAVEQAVPTSYWGKRFVVVRSSIQLNDRIRITSLEDNCQIYRDGILSATIGRGETYQYEMPFLNKAEYVETTKPVSVNDFFASMGTGIGDPSMVTIAPIEQMANDVTFGCFNTDYTTSHNINIVVRTEDRPLLRLDGSIITDTFRVLEGNPQYMYGTVPVLARSHTLSMNGGAGFVAYAFGKGSHESYAYSIGSSMRTLSNRLYVDGNQLFSGNWIDRCDGTPLHLSVGYDSIPDSVVWHLGNGSVFLGDSLDWTYPSDGQYLLQSIFCLSTGGCFDGVNDTISVNVTIHPNDTIDIDTLTCSIPFIWYDTEISDSGSYSHLLQSSHGCDSLLRMNIDFRSIPVTEYVHEGCDSVIIDGVTYIRDTRQNDTLQSEDGCDSLVVQSIVVHPSYFHNDDVTLEEGDTLLWIDGNEYWSEDQHPTITYSTRYGCDSIEQLRIRIIPPYVPPRQDSASIWIPNAFTPDEETNNIFKVESYDIVEMRIFVFTRQGLYVTDFDGLSAGWDGTCKNMKCKQGTYVYQVEYRSKSMPSVLQKRIGTVILLR